MEKKVFAIIAVVLMASSAPAYAFEDEIYDSPSVEFSVPKNADMEQRRQQLLKNDRNIEKKLHDRAEKTRKERIERRKREFLSLIRKYNDRLSKPLTKSEVKRVAMRLALKGKSAYEMDEFLKVLDMYRAPGQFIDEVMVFSPGSFSRVNSVYNKKSKNTAFGIDREFNLVEERVAIKDFTYGRGTTVIR